MCHIQAFHSESGAPNDTAGITQFFTLTNTDETKTLLTKSLNIVILASDIQHATIAFCLYQNILQLSV